jgi:hypothetical protein
MLQEMDVSVNGCVLLPLQLSGHPHHALCSLSGTAAAAASVRELPAAAAVRQALSSSRCPLGNAAQVAGSLSALHGSRKFRIG